MSNSDPNGTGAEDSLSAEAWNAGYKIGQRVIVTRDDGSKWITKTRSEAWNLGHGQPVVMLEGKSGGYDLGRVKPISEPMKEQDVWAALEAERTQSGRSDE